MAFDIFLKLAGLPGDAITKGHEDEIDVQSFSWGESRDGTTADPQEMAFVTPLSKASPVIAKHCAEGTPIASAEISVNTGSLKLAGELLMIKLAGITVGSYQLGVADTDPAFNDRFTLAFQSVTVTKRQGSATGAIGGATSVDISFPPPAA